MMASVRPANRDVLAYHNIITKSVYLLRQTRETITERPALPFTLTQLWETRAEMASGRTKSTLRSIIAIVCRVTGPSTKSLTYVATRGELRDEITAHGFKVETGTAIVAHWGTSQTPLGERSPSFESKQAVAFGERHTGHRQRGIW